MPAWRFLEPARRRLNLHVITGAHVERLEFEGVKEKASAATGVSYIDDKGEKHFISATKEVILAAGTFASPQLLELSGIGDPSILNKHQIPLIYANRHVGENLQDHIRGGLSFEAKESWFPDPPEGARKAYETRTGPWAERLAHSFAYMPLAPFLSPAEEESLAKHLQTHMQNPNLSPFEKQHTAFISKMLHSPTEATAVTFLISRPVVIDSETTSKPWLSFNSMLAHPFSRGNSHIASPDPKVRPTIDCALLLLTPRLGNPRAPHPRPAAPSPHRTLRLLPQTQRRAAAAAGRRRRRSDARGGEGGIESVHRDQLSSLRDVRHVARGLGRGG